MPDHRCWSIPRCRVRGRYFLKGEVRYASVVKAYPNEAAELFDAAKANAQWRYNNYRRLSQQQWGVDPLVEKIEDNNK